MRYINIESIVRNEVKSLFSKASRTVDRSYNAISHEGNPIFCPSVEFSIEDSFWYAWVIIQLWSA